jgi:septum site-determining protein MinD
VGFQGKMSKLIVVTSGKGGVGKTTTAINLGAALNSFGQDVVIVDGNLTTPNVGLHMGAPIVPVSLNHVLSGKAKVDDAIYEHESGTKIMPSSLSVKELRKINHGKMKDVGKKLRRISDYIILDSAAGLGDEAVAAIETADELILVTNPEIPAVTDALKTCKLIEQMGKSVRGLIVTRVRGGRAEMSLESIKDMLELPILGVVPEDRNVPLSVVQKDALVHTHPKSRAARAYKRIAAKLIGKSDYREPGFFGRLFGF